MKKKILIATGIIVVVIILVIIYSSTGKEKAEQLLVEVQRGQFEVLVTVTGELQAENS